MRIYFTALSNLILITFISISIFSCAQKKGNLDFNYGTQSDSALYYYNLGWHQIMDLGQWTKAELSFRKAIEIDPEFIIAQSLVGRISRDPNERQEIFNSLQGKEVELNDDQALIFKKYLDNIRFMNAREASNENANEIRDAMYYTTLQDFKKFLEKYPNESWVKAEYIEVIDAVYGKQAALDSILKLTTPEEEKTPFFVRYEGKLWSETGQINKALEKARQLDTLINPLSPARFTLFAQIYLGIDSLDLAKMTIDKAIAIDSNNLSAKGLQSRIIQLMNEQNRLQ